MPDRSVPRSGVSRRKIALFCDVDEEAVITAKDVASIYEVPLVLAAREGSTRIVLQVSALAADRAPAVAGMGRIWSTGFGIRSTRGSTIHGRAASTSPAIEDWVQEPQWRRSRHGGFPHGLKVSDQGGSRAEALEAPGGESLLADASGILVPGGFGDRGTRGDDGRRPRVARERNIPLLRHLLRVPVRRPSSTRGTWPACPMPTSTECAPETPTKVIYKLRDLARRRRPGRDHPGCGTVHMRAAALALSPRGCFPPEWVVARERHRHRYEFNLSVREGPRPTHGLWISAARSTASSSRSSSSPAIRGIWPSSSTPSSRRSPLVRIRCSPGSSKQPTSGKSARRARPRAQSGTRRYRARAAATYNQAP